MKNCIAKIRKDLGVTQYDVCKILGWRQTRLSNYETGYRTESIKLVDATNIVRALNELGAAKHYGANLIVEDVFYY